ncbi:MAG: hypothetical protein COC08_08960 [Maribacter sp.]|nr:MAG: hypothetical protein COC08_08960 [Maribacter sp.]
MFVLKAKRSYIFSRTLMLLNRVLRFILTCKRNTTKMRYILRSYTFILMFCTGIGFLQAQYLKVSDNDRYLVTDDDKPFFWLADTAWELFHRLSITEAETYLKTRKAQGFTVIQAVILAEINGLTTPTPEGDFPLIDQDVARPNEDYFKKVDKIIKIAASYGLYMAVLPTWGSHAQDVEHYLFDNLNLFNKDNAYQYGKFLGERYKEQCNVVWVLGGDRMPESTEKIWTPMAKGLNAGSGGQQLLTYHPNGIHSTVEFSEKFPWLGFHSFQSGHSQENYPVYTMVAAAYTKRPTMPVLNMEPSYEYIGKGFNPINGYYTDYDSRKAAYWSVFAGAFGHTYGHNCVWQMWSSKHRPILYADIPWYKAIHSVGSYQMHHIKDLMLSRPFKSRIPDQSIILSDIGIQSDYTCATRDGNLGKNDATYIMVYLPVIKNFKINTTVISGKKIKVWWFNPRNGIAFFQGEYDNTGTFSQIWGNRIDKNMGGPDWVLVIDDATKKYDFNLLSENF